MTKREDSSGSLKPDTPNPGPMSQEEALEVIGRDSFVGEILGIVMSGVYEEPGLQFEETSMQEIGQMTILERAIFTYFSRLNDSIRARMQVCRLSDMPRLRIETELYDLMKSLMFTLFKLRLDREVNCVTQGYRVATRKESAADQIFRFMDGDLTQEDLERMPKELQDFLAQVIG